MASKHNWQARPQDEQERIAAALAACYRVLFALVDKYEQEAADRGEFGDLTRPAASAAVPDGAPVQGAWYHDCP